MHMVRQAVCSRAHAPCSVIFAAVPHAVGCACVRPLRSALSCWPSCGRLHADVDYQSRNVLADPELREAIKKFSNWPTIPQVAFCAHTCSASCHFCSNELPRNRLPSCNLGSRIQMCNAIFMTSTLTAYSCHRAAVHQGGVCGRQRHPDGPAPQRRPADAAIGWAQGAHRGMMMVFRTQTAGVGGCAADLKTATCAADSKAATAGRHWTITHEDCRDVVLT